MPCCDNRDDDSHLRERNDKLARMLCSVCKNIEAGRGEIGWSQTS